MFDVRHYDDFSGTFYRLLMVDAIKILVTLVQPYTTDLI